MELQLPNSGAFGLLWIDLETTGTSESYDEIIEIGAVVTDFEFNQLGSTFSVLIRPDTFAMGRMMYEPVVRDMHLKNGLLDHLLALPDNGSYDIDAAQTAMLKWLNGILNKGKTRGPVEKFRFMLAGSGVQHFDRKFIDEYMPKIAELLVFYPLDTGNIRRFFRMCGVDAPLDNPNNKSHRALDDVLAHLEEARRFKEWLIELESE